MPAYAVDPGTIAPDRAGRSGAGLQFCRHGPYNASCHAARQSSPAGFRLACASFTISTPQGRLTVDGIVRSPFGIDQRTMDEAGTRGWSVTHLPSGLAVVRQIKVLAVALAFVDRIAPLIGWKG